uniref:Uncharacterized protein n=1 Tax=viral metagenome TaxID=1070528 RepID=A0A6C0JEQ0_9ZZZZ
MYNFIDYNINIFAKNISNNFDIDINLLTKLSKTFNYKIITHTSKHHIYIDKNDNKYVLLFDDKLDKETFALNLIE